MLTVLQYVGPLQAFGDGREVFDDLALGQGQGRLRGRDRRLTNDGCRIAQ